MDKKEFTAGLDGLSEDKRAEMIKVFDESEKSQKNYDLKMELGHERDKHKTRTKELEEEKEKALQKIVDLEKAQAVKSGDVQSLYENSVVEVTALKEKVTNFEKEIETSKDYKTRFEDVETERRKELIEQLPEGEFREIAETIADRTMLKKYVVKIIATLDNDIIPDGSKAGNLLELGKKTWNTLSMKEKDELKIGNPKRYKELYNNRNINTGV